MLKGKDILYNETGLFGVWDGCYKASSSIP